MKAYIETKALHAVSMFQAVKDDRYYLKGVYVEYNEMETRVIATDGHCLGAYRIDARGENQASGNLIIPTDAVKQILAWKAKHVTVEPELTDSLWYSASCQAGHIVKFMAIDGRFPDYRRVLVSRGPLSNEPAQYDARLIGMFQKAAVALRAGSKELPVVAIGYNGENATPVELNGNPDFAGIIMPWRQNVPGTSPSWAYSALPDAPAPAVDTEAAPAADTEAAPATAAEVL